MTHWKWNFLAQILKKLLYFLIFPEMDLSSSNIKKIPHIFRDGTLHFLSNALKIYYALGNENLPKNLFLIFFIVKIFA